VLDHKAKQTWSIAEGEKSQMLQPCDMTQKGRCSHDQNATFFGFSNHGYPGLFSVGFWLVIVWHPGMIMSLGVFMHPKRRRPRELGPKGVQSDGQSLDGDI